jgi:hypothetical protein
VAARRSAQSADAVLINTVATCILPHIANGALSILDRVGEMEPRRGTMRDHEVSVAGGVQLPLRVRRLLGLCLTRDPRYRLRDISGAKFLFEESLATKVAGSLPWMTATALAFARRRSDLVAVAETTATGPSVDALERGSRTECRRWRPYHRRHFS